MFAKSVSVQNGFANDIPNSPILAEERYLKRRPSERRSSPDRDLT
jgi:hypothetical protein